MEGQDFFYMQRALDLARLGMGSVSPNPMVGAVIVHNNAIIGEGWHKRYGGPHAEVEAVQSVKEPALLRESTMYVTLEPCSHYGKTPPCADLVVNSGFKKVVVGMLDPNPLVAGRGLAKLRQAGIEVKIGVLESKAIALNKRFLTNMESKRPFVVLKWAQSADGYIAPSLTAQKSEKQISNKVSRQLVHKWRAEEDAIMVGFNTLLHDNPKLDVRYWMAHKQPIRVTLEDREMLDVGEYHFFDGTQTSIVYNFHREDLASHVRYFRLEEREASILQLLEGLYKQGIGSILVEGGRKLLDKFLKANLWDEARICTSPKTLGVGIQAPILHVQSHYKFRLLEDEWVIVPNRQAKSAK